jgi:hypothetical protein
MHTQVSRATLEKKPSEPPYWLCREVPEGGEQGERGFVATEERRGAESACGLWEHAYRRSNRADKLNPPPPVGGY